MRRDAMRRALSFLDLIRQSDPGLRHIEQRFCPRGPKASERSQGSRRRIAGSTL
jgi:hypothetical protein